jgi:simple sugar transport system ATP-binding protein
MSVFENMCVAGLDDPALTRGPFLRLKAMHDRASSLIDRFEVKTPSPDLLVGNLSGGNQQKVVVARTLARRPDLLVAANPTRGLDIRATNYVHDRIVQAAAQGTAVVLVSTDLDELRSLAHRTAFLSRGQFVDHIVGSSS